MTKASSLAGRNGAADQTTVSIDTQPDDNDHQSAHNMDMPDQVAELKRPAGRPASSLQIAYDAYDRFSERIRALRTELLLRRQRGRASQTLAVLSACPREGRSHLAAALAVSFAQLGRPCLLVDADLRLPRQHALFNLPNNNGLSRALATRTAVAPVTIEGLPDLAVLPAGHEVANPLELLSHRRFDELLEQWRNDYEFILFDTAPVQLYSDALAVAKVAGEVLTLTRAQHTPYLQARDLLRRLAATESRVLGAVINHF